MTQRRPRQNIFIFRVCLQWDNHISHLWWITLRPRTFFLVQKRSTKPTTSNCSIAIDGSQAVVLSTRPSCPTKSILTFKRYPWIQTKLKSSVIVAALPLCAVCAHYAAVPHLGVVVLVGARGREAFFRRFLSVCVCAWLKKTSLTMSRQEWTSSEPIGEQWPRFEYEKTIILQSLIMWWTSLH